ncbi:MAG TPA: cupredoxin domain-containing protein [Dehalococcoidia bacterium]|nr:cupredoxin domain-containing protein [Dehalococcoidia bacterium]
MRRWQLLLALPALLLLACSSSEGSKTLTLGSLTYNSHGTKSVKGKSSFDLEADSFYFEPTFLRGDPGQKIELEVENDSKTVTHNISVPGQSVNMDVAPKQKVDVTVTIPQSGAAIFFCRFHTGQGMNGELLAGDTQPQPVNAPAPAGSPRSQVPSSPRY